MSNHWINRLSEEPYEVRSLGEVIEKFVGGVGKITKSTENDGNYPTIICKDVFDSDFCINECKYFVDETKFKRLSIAESGDILVAWNGYTKTQRKGFSLFTGNYKALVGNNIYILKHSQDPKYLSFALNTRGTERQMNNYFKVGFSSMLSIHLSDIKKIKIPIPLLKIQQKIADFLFPFIQYDLLLKKELYRRKKQYEFYREFLFDVGINQLGWEMKNMSEISTEEIYRGIGVSKDQLGTGKHPAIKCGDINTSLPIVFENCVSFVNPDLIKRKKYFDHGDILIGKIGDPETAGKACAYLGKDRCLLGDSVYVLKHKQSPKYLAYALSSKFVRQQIKEIAQKSTVFQIYLYKLEQIQIPLPSLEEQERIVAILDRFYDICENPEKGLQLLIKQNQKQYEYYREHIFSQMDIEI